MVRHDEEALVCDLAETYGIYDYKRLPVLQVAVFANGLSEKSRIKKSMAGGKEDLETLLLAGIFDTVRLLMWAKTKDGMAGRNRPKAILQALEGARVVNQEQVFYSGKEFEQARRKIQIDLGGEGDGHGTG